MLCVVVFESTCTNQSIVQYLFVQNIDRRWRPSLELSSIADQQVLVTSHNRRTGIPQLWTTCDIRIRAMADYESLKDKYRQSQAEVIDYFCRWTTDMTVRWLLIIWLTPPQLGGVMFIFPFSRNLGITEKITDYSWGYRVGVKVRPRDSAPAAHR